MGFSKIERRRIGISVILTGLVVVLFAFAGHLHERFTFVTTVNYKWDSLKTYTGLNKTLNYKLPEDWESNLRDLASNEIGYHNEFNSSDFLVHGIVQVWKINGDLKVFLDKSKEASEKQNTISNYKIKTLKINNKDGYFVTYDVKGKNNVIYRAMEYFVRYQHSFVRFSFFTKDSLYSESLKVSLENIVRTLNYEEVMDNGLRLSSINYFAFKFLFA